MGVWKRRTRRVRVKLDFQTERIWRNFVRVVPGQVRSTSIIVSLCEVHTYIYIYTCIHIRYMQASSTYFYSDRETSLRDFAQGETHRRNCRQIHRKVFSIDRWIKRRGCPTDIWKVSEVIFSRKVRINLISRFATVARLKYFFTLCARDDFCINNNAIILKGDFGNTHILYMSI